MNSCIFNIFVEIDFLEMTISYTLDVSQTNNKSVLKLLCRWRGSVWKATLPQLAVWTSLYMLISCMYRFMLTPIWQRYIFDHRRFSPHNKI